MLKKRVICLVFVVAMCFGLTVSVSADSRDVGVEIDGVPLHFSGQGPVVVDGRTLVPARAVFEALGFYVSWNGETGTVTMTKGGNTIVITIGSVSFRTNAVSHRFDVPAQIIGNSTMIPIRLPLESVGYAVGWNNAQNMVTITSPLTHEEYISGLFGLINGERAIHGLSPLEWNEDLAVTAQRRIENNRCFQGDVLTISRTLLNPRPAPASLLGEIMGDYKQRSQILNPAALSMGMGFASVEPIPYLGSREELGMFFATATEIAPLASPINIHNMQDAGTWPESSITLQNRQQTPAERDAWIAEYHAMGGPSAFELAILDELNIVRAEHGLNMLVWDYELGMASRYFTQLAVNLDFDRRNATMGEIHNWGPYGGSVGVARSFGVASRRGAAGQWGNSTPDGIIRRLMNSEIHRQILLRDNITSGGWGSTIGGTNQYGIVHYFMAR